MNNNSIVFIEKFLFIFYKMTILVVFTQCSKYIVRIYVPDDKCCVFSLYKEFVFSKGKSDIVCFIPKRFLHSIIEIVLNSGI